MELEDYKNLKFSERRELDKKAYANYYDQSFPDDDMYDDYAWISWNNAQEALTFNEFYGTELHKKFLLPLLRKLKLEQIKKVSE